jgi:hypothetical protein
MSDWTLITGTGRSGTSCFAKLMNACFPDRPMPGADYWNENVNAGCEGSLDTFLNEGNTVMPPGTILKDPRAEDFVRLANSGCLPSFVFVCFRPLHLTAKSRMANKMTHLGAFYEAMGRPAGGVEEFKTWAMATLTDSRAQLLSDYINVAMVMGTIWQHNIPHAILKYPDFVTDAETLYGQVNAALPIGKGVFMEKHAEIMDPSLVHIK